MTKISNNQQQIIDFIKENQTKLAGVSVNDILDLLPMSGGQGQTNSRRTNVNKTLVQLVDRNLLTRTRVLDKDTSISQYKYFVTSV